MRRAAAAVLRVGRRRRRAGDGLLQPLVSTADTSSRQESRAEAPKRKERGGRESSASPP
jgi:hypothetical protein